METPPRVVVGQGGSPSTPASGATYESPATLLSSARVKVIDLLCAGEIGGLVDGAKSIYLDDTPVENPNGTVNFTGFNYTLNVGTPTQAPLLGFDEVETHEDVGVKITNSLAAGVTRTVTDPDADACKVILQANSFYRRNKEGSIYGTSVRYRIDVSANGGPFVEVALQNMNGCAYSPYQRQIVITLKDKGSGPWQIRVTRTTPDRDPVNYADEIYFHSLTTVKYLKMRYPGCAVLGFEIDAKQFASIPQRSYDCYLQLVKVPTNYDPVTRAYATTGPGTTGGIWDGSFKVAWTDNPAWCWYDLLTNTTHGLGEYLDSLYIDKFTLYTIGQYCDQLVPDGYGGMEPRFRCNLLLQSREEAMKVVANMGSIFRAMIYWHAGMLIPVQDRPRDPVKNFTNANVVEGKFTYMGTPRKSRHTVALVRWNDPDDLYRVKVEYVEDMDGIRELGVRETETTAFGCTSRGQAHRHGKWALFSEVNETEFVDFVTGTEGSYVRPGEVINVFDRDKAGDRYGGRLVSNTTTSCVIDSPVTIQAGKTHTLYLTLSDGTVVTRTLTNAAASNVTTLTWSSALPSSVVTNGVWGLAIVGVVEPQQFLVLAVTEEESGTFHISGKEYIGGKFDFIENDIKFEPRPTSTLPNPKDGVAAPTSLNVAKTFSVVDGVFRRELLVSWTHSTHAYLRNYIISYRLDNDNWVTAGTTTSPMFQFRAPRPGVYAIRVETVSMIGLHSLPAEITYSLDDSIIKTSRITGLELKDQGNDTTFEGEDIRLVWRHNSADTATELADLASGERHPLLRGYLVEIFSDEAMLKRVKESEVLTPAFLYSYDENFRDSFGAPRRTLTFRVRAVDNYGQYSQATSITVYNPAPLIGDNPPTVDTSEISYQGVSGRIAVQLANVDDNDYQGMLIFASRNPAFALTDVRAAVGSEPKPEAMVPYAFDRSTGIDAGMLLYNGTNTQVSLEVIDNSVYYVIFAFYDGFGMEGINYYGPVAINVPVLAAGAPAPVVKINATAYTFAHNKSGAITPASATLTATTVNITVTSYQWQFWNGTAWTDISGQTSATLTRASAEVTSQVVTYRCLVNGTHADSVSLGHTYDGADELLAMLDNEAHTIACTSAGVPSAGQLGAAGTAKSKVMVYRGSGLLTPVVGTPAANQFSLSLAGTSCTASVTGAGDTIQLDSVSADAGYVTTTINVENQYSLTKVFSWAKARAGVDGSTAKVVTLTADSQTFQIPKGGGVFPASIVFTAYGQNVTGSPVFSVLSGTANLTGTGNTRMLTYANLTSDAATIQVTWDGQSDFVSVVKVREGTDAVASFLTNEAHTVPTDSAGANGVFTGAVTTMSVFRGIADDSSSWTFSQVATGCTVTASNSNRTATVTAMSADVGYVDITATLAGYPTQTRRFTVTKSKAGTNGTNGSNGQDGAPGANATRIATLDMYRWATSAPSTWPAGAVTYTWATGAFTDPATLNSWSRAIPSGAAGQTLYRTRSIYSDTGTSATSAITPSWTSAEPIGRYGNDGQSATAYWLVNAASAIQRTIAGVYTPTALAVSSMSQTGTGAPAAYGGRYIVATTVDGTTWVNQYTSAANESSYSYTVPAGIKAIRVRLYQAGGTTVLLDEEIVPIVTDGATGSQGTAGTNGTNGADAVVSVLSNQSHTVPADNAGNVTSFAGAVTTMSVFKGLTDDSANWTFAQATTGCTVTASGSPANRTATVTAMSADVAFVDITATRSGHPTHTQRFTIAKAKQGAQGPTGSAGADSLRTLPASFAPGAIGGYSDFVFTPNQIWDGAANAAEIRVQGTTFVHPDGALRTLTAVGSNATDIYTSLGEGYTGKAFLMWTDTLAQVRWPTGSYGNCRQIVPVVYEGGAWKMLDNNSVRFDITLAATDVLIAAMESGASGIGRFESFLDAVAFRPVSLYKRDATGVPAAPTGASPAGWEESIPAGSAPLWVSTGTKTSTGLLVGSWTTVRRVPGTATFRTTRASIPSAVLLAGDLCYDTGADLRLYRWTGSAWEDSQKILRMLDLPELGVSNRVANCDFAAGDVEWSKGSVQWAIVAAGTDKYRSDFVARYTHTTGGSAIGIWNTAQWRITPGEKLHVRLALKKSADFAAAGVQVRFETFGSAYADTASANLLSSTGTAWTEHEFIIAAPTTNTDAVRGQLTLFVHSSTAGSLWLGRMEARSAITAGMIGAEQIIANSANIANAVINDVHITTMNVAKLVSGTISGKDFVLDRSGSTAGAFRSTGATAFGTGTGLWLGVDGDGVAKFRVGDPAGSRLLYNGSQFELIGATLQAGSGSQVLRIAPADGLIYGYGQTNNVRLKLVTPPWEGGGTGSVAGISLNAPLVGVETEFVKISASGETGGIYGAQGGIWIGGASYGGNVVNSEMRLGSRGVSMFANAMADIAALSIGTFGPQLQLQSGSDSVFIRSGSINFVAGGGGADGIELLRSAPQTLSASGKFIATELSAAPASGDAVMSAVAGAAASRVRYQATVPTVGTWYWGADGADGAKWKLAWNSATFASPALSFETGGAATFASDVSVNRRIYSNPTVNDWSFLLRRSGEADYRLLVDATGKIIFGNGASSAGRDTTLYRGAANNLITDGQLNVGGHVHVPRPNAGDWALSSTYTGKPTPPFILTANGVLNWGSGDSGTDTNLYRASAGVVRTSGALQATEYRDDSGNRLLGARKAAIADLTTPAFTPTGTYGSDAPNILTAINNAYSKINAVLAVMRASTGHGLTA